MIEIPALQVTDEAQIRGLSFVTAKHNATNPDAPLTREQYAQLVMQEALNSWGKAEADDLYARAQAIYQSASPEGQQQILQSLGIADRTYGFLE